MGDQGSEPLGTFVDGRRDVFSGALDQHTPTHSLLPVDVVDLEADRRKRRVEGLGSLVGLEDNGLTFKDKPHRKHEG
jgi:hypothetical protein